MATKKKVIKKSRVDKPFNSNTMSKASFFSFIRSALGQKSRWWKPIAECKNNAKRAYTGKSKRQKWEYQCSHCKEWFSDKEVAVDHIIEAGTLKDYDDLPGFVQRLFCEVDNLQLLCDKRLDGKESCHKIKTQNYMKDKR